MSLHSRLVSLATIALVVGSVGFLASVDTAPVSTAQADPENPGEELPEPVKVEVKGPDPDEQTYIEFPKGSGQFLTSKKQITVEVKIAPALGDSAGKLQLHVNSDPPRLLDPNSVDLTKIPVDLEEEGKNFIAASWTPEESKTPIGSNRLEVVNDSTGPILQRAVVIDDPLKGSVLIVSFAEGDFKEDTLASAFTVHRQNTSGAFADNISPIERPVSDGNLVRLTFGSLPAGEYRVTVKGSGGNELTDLVGNAANEGADKYVPFSVLPERKFGEHVEFPPYAPPKEQSRTESFNPNDYVITRVARLYYYRDAHRVAQIINRNVRSYNEAAVKQAERRAEQAREDFEEKVDERRKSEREAVRAAQASRNAEQELANARYVQGLAKNTEDSLQQLEARQTEIKKLQGRVEELERIAITDENDLKAKKAEADTADQAVEDATRELQEEKVKLAAAAPAEKPDIQKKVDELEVKVQNAEIEAKKAHERVASAEDKAKASRLAADNEAAKPQNAKLSSEFATNDAKIKQLKKDKEKLGDSSSFNGTITELEQRVARQRQTEIVKQEAAHDAQALEDRAAKKQFREEVAAAEADPDTYVPGKLNSVDPITQVSISVIGEGLIQLRGPIKGVNKIRTAINQIDAPVGQVKNGILTIQVNGEHGDRMEKVVGRIEGHIDLGRFLTNQSLSLLRRAIQTEAAIVAQQCEAQGHYQVDRDRKYLYMFFGRDFIDELYAIDSEFLRSENKLLSLHAMDTVSLNRALFVLALAKNDVRERIIARFLESAKTDLADSEFDFRRSSELHPHTTQKLIPIPNATHLPFMNKNRIEQKLHEAVHRNAMQRYHFRNFRGFFNAGFGNSDIINPTQREFIKLAQIFKSRMVAELEWKQRVMERALIQERSNDEDARFEIMQRVHVNALAKLEVALNAELNATGDVADVVAKAVAEVDATLKQLPQIEPYFQILSAETNNLKKDLRKKKVTEWRKDILKFYETRNEFKEVEDFLDQLKDARWISRAEGSQLEDAVKDSQQRRKNAKDSNKKEEDFVPDFTRFGAAIRILDRRKSAWQPIEAESKDFLRVFEDRETTPEQLDRAYKKFTEFLLPLQDTPAGKQMQEQIRKGYEAKQSVIATRRKAARLEEFLVATRGDLDHRKLLNLLIDEQEDKFIDLIEGTRSHIAAIDNYLKRLSIALEDDFKVQFYDPAFVRIRDAAREHDVSLGQVERTTILTNNRAFAKVSPQATMEFDLPKRQIAIKEAFDAAKALVEDTGALVNDPTFLAAFQMMGGSKQPAKVDNVLPGLPSSTDQHNMGLVPQQQPGAQGPGSALQSLVPEPAIFKLETGTGFEIRPVIQPDGDSIVYDFDYMYTTNVREPVRADEKHLGRVKRHFVHTQVQTSSFELREISRYQVALKVSRTGRGVPLLEDIPGLGALFRPAPSAESAIQQNIILGQTTVYPTLFDLMGLRWAPVVVDLDHASLLDSEHVIRGRRQAIRDFVFHEAQHRVDDFIRMRGKFNGMHYRPDLYFPHARPSPYHPSGYTAPGVIDPTGRRFERTDRRPPENQLPPYELYRHRPVHPERIGPNSVPESIPITPPGQEPRSGGSQSVLEPTNRRSNDGPPRGREGTGRNPAPPNARSHDHRGPGNQRHPGEHTHHSWPWRGQTEGGNQQPRGMQPPPSQGSRYQSVPPEFDPARAARANYRGPTNVRHPVRYGHAPAPEQRRFEHHARPPFGSRDPSYDHHSQQRVEYNPAASNVNPRYVPMGPRGQYPYRQTNGIRTDTHTHPSARHSNQTVPRFERDVRRSAASQDGTYDTHRQHQVPTTSSAPSRTPASSSTLTPPKARRSYESQQAAVALPALHLRPLGDVHPLSLNTELGVVHPVSQ